MEDIEIIAYEGYTSAIESHPNILVLLGIMTARFNVLENNLSTLICIKSSILLKSSVYDYISKELYLAQKIKMAEDFLSEGLPSELFKINDKRKMIIHGLYIKNMGTGIVSLNYKNQKISNLEEFLTQLNEEISTVCQKIHNLT